MKLKGARSMKTHYLGIKVANVGLFGLGIALGAGVAHF